MEYLLRFANASMLLFLFPVVVFFVLLRVWLHRPVTYNYSLTSELKSNNFVSKHNYKIILFCIRLLVLLGIVLSISRPQIVDTKSNMLVDGIDIMLVLDASESMNIQDQLEKNRSRFDVAKHEAIRFIKKRKNDPIGLVIFGKDAISRCPITLDKKIITSIVDDLKIGSVDPEGTVLSIAILTAANRLKNSKSKNKVMIVLTDGDPSPFDQAPEVSVELAKRMGIKIYTVGIGSDKDSIVRHPFYGVIQIKKINKGLLGKIAEDTGGKFFLAKNQRDMRKIYDVIDQLEKTEYETDIFSRYYELFMIFLWIVVVFFLLEVFFSSVLWFSL